MDQDTISPQGLTWRTFPKAGEAYPGVGEVHLRLVQMPPFPLRLGDRSAWLVSRRQSLLRTLSLALGQSLREDDILRLPGGKPFLRPLADRPPLTFSLSHCDRLMLIALAAQGSLGVDLERVRPVPQALQIASRCASSEEQDLLRACEGPARDHAFLHLWVRFEAALKRDGSGLRRLVEVQSLLAASALESFRVGGRFVAAIAAPRGIRILRAARSGRSFDQGKEIAADRAA